MKISNRQFRKLLKENHPRASVDNLLFDYNEYVRAEGHVTPAASSVIASFFLTLPDGVDDHEAHEILATEYGIDHQDIMRDIDRQQAEKAIAPRLSQEVPELTGGRKSSWQTTKEKQIGESKKMRMTKRQLRRLIEETHKTLQEDHVDTELDHLQKNVHDDIEHIRDLKDDIHDDHEEELRAEKDKREEADKKDERINHILRRAARRLFELATPDATKRQTWKDRMNAMGYTDGLEGKGPVSMSSLEDPDYMAGKKAGERDSLNDPHADRSFIELDIEER